MLLRSLFSDLSQLLRQEIALAKLEMAGAARGLARAGSRIAIGAGVAALGALTLLAAAVVLLGELIGSYWLGALVVALLLLGIAGLAAIAGMRRVRSADPVPRQAIDSVRTTARWARAEALKLKAALLGPVRRGNRGGTALRLPPGGAGSAAAEHPRTTPPALPPGGRTEHGSPGGPTAARTGRGGAAHPLQTADREGAAGKNTAPASRSSSRTPPPRSAGQMAFLKHVAGEIQEDEITGQAAKLAYYAFMAMPPALMALFGLAGLVGSTRLAGWLQEQAALTIPAAVNQDIIGPFIEQVVLEEAPGPFSVGLLLALWGGSAVFAGLIDTLNHAYDVEESRSFVRKRGLALLIMLGGVVLFVGAAGTLLVAPALVDMLGLGGVGATVWNIVQWPVAFAFMVAAFWCAYYFLPNRDQRPCRTVLVKAAAVAAALWVLATAAFRIYISNFSSYSETYGFLGAFIILLLWLYVTGLVVLVGGELASEMERRT